MYKRIQSHFYTLEYVSQYCCTCYISCVMRMLNAIKCIVKLLESRPPSTRQCEEDEKETRLILKIRKHFNSLVSQHQSNYAQHVSRDIKKLTKELLAMSTVPVCTIVNYFPQCDHKNSTPAIFICVRGIHIA